jgi:hypothetical protein
MYLGDFSYRSESETRRVGNFEVLQQERGPKLQGYIVDRIRVIGRVEEGTDCGDLLGDWRSLLERTVSQRPNLHKLDHFYRTQLRPVPWSIS